MLWSLAEREMDLETLICVDLVQVVMGRKLMHLQRARYPDGWWIHTVDMFGSLLLVLFAVSLISMSFVQFVFCFQRFHVRAQSHGTALLLPL